MKHWSLKWMYEWIFGMGFVEDASKAVEDTAGTVSDTTPEVKETVDASGKQPTNAVTEQYLWDKDERYEKMWKKNPNELYKSYKNLEKIYEPAKQELGKYKGQFEQLNALAKEYGISVEQLKDVLNEHKTLKDPENPVNQRASYFGNWIDNPTYKDKVISFYQELENAELNRKYPNMNAEQIKRQVELESKTTKLESELEKIQVNELTNKNMETINSTKNTIESYSKDKGFNFTPEMWNGLLEHCHKEGVLPKHIYAEFVKLYNKEYDKAYSEKVKNEQLQALNKNKNNVVVGAKGSASSSSSSSKGGLKERLSSILDASGYK